MMQFSDFMQWSFLGIVSGGVIILWQMKSSMNDLNTKIEVFVERLGHHQEKLESFGLRLNTIERYSFIIKNNKEF